MRPAIENLLSLLADGRFHSGVELGECLGVSRAAISTQVRALEGYGLEVFAVKGRGYRLAKPLECLQAEVITAALTPETDSLLRRLEVCGSVDSTNRVIASAAQAGAPSGTVCLAEHQSEGRGRRGRSWVSPFGANLYLSLLWRFENGASSLGALGLVCAVTLVRALRALGVEGCGIKWPNDILCEGRKLAGILIELAGEAAGPCYVTIGIGMNVAMDAVQARDIDQPWCALEQVAGRAISRNTLAARILNELLPEVGRFQHSGFAPYVDEWRRYDLLEGQEVRLLFPGRESDGVVLGIDDSGALLLRQGGEVVPYTSGEVSLRLAANA